MVERCADEAADYVLGRLSPGAFGFRVYVSGLGCWCVGVLGVGVSGVGQVRVYGKAERSREGVAGTNYNAKPEKVGGSIMPLPVGLHLCAEKLRFRSPMARKPYTPSNPTPQAPPAPGPKLDPWCRTLFNTLSENPCNNKIK